MIHAEYLGLAFALSEILLAMRRRAARTDAVSHDAGTLKLVWLGIAAAMFAAVWIAGNVELGRFAAGAWSAVALTLFAGGIALRWWAILTLGRFFTVDVAIHGDHELVTRGPYRALRHPSYTGVLAAFAGLGLTLGSWPALAALLVPITAVLVRRIQVEERALATRFGPEWGAHRERTWRLVPFFW